MTDLENGVFVYIDPVEFDKLKNRFGFLSIENYPDNYKEFVVEGELGRFLIFRFIAMNMRFLICGKSNFYEESAEASTHSKDSKE